MKKIILFSIALMSLFSACKKDEIDLNKVDTIVIKGQFLSLETGNPLSLATLVGNFGNNAAQLWYRMPSSNKYQIPIMMRDKVSNEGAFEFYVDSVSAFVQKQAINFVAFAPNHANCDTIMNRCSMEPTFKMPFSAFEQKQVGTTLFLTYNVKLTAQASLNFEIKGLAVNDSIAFRYEYINPCRSSIYLANHGHKVTVVNTQYPNSYGIGQFIPNRNYKITVSKLRDKKIIKTYDWEGQLEPRESRRVPLQMD